MRHYFHPSGEHIISVEQGWLNLVDVYYVNDFDNWYRVQPSGSTAMIARHNVPPPVQMAHMLIKD